MFPQVIHFVNISSRIIIENKILIVHPSLEMENSLISILVIFALIISIKYVLIVNRCTYCKNFIFGIKSLKFEKLRKEVSLCKKCLKTKTFHRMKSTREVNYSFILQNKIFVENAIEQVLKINISYGNDHEDIEPYFIDDNYLFAWSLKRDRLCVFNFNRIKSVDYSSAK